MKYQYLEAPSFWSVIAYKSNYIKRLLGTGLGFSLLGIGGLLICISVFPLISLLTRDSLKRQNRVRFVIRKSFRVYLKCLILLGVIKVKTSNLEKLQSIKGVLIICNHPTLLDVVIIMAHLGNLQCVVKKELWRNPFLGGVVRAAGYIRNDLNPEQFSNDCKDQLKQGENIIIFPEGTRSIPGQPIKLHRSLGNLALEAGVNIQALTMDCTPITLIKGESGIRSLQVPQFFTCSAENFFAAKTIKMTFPDLSG